MGQRLRNVENVDVRISESGSSTYHFSDSDVGLRLQFLVLLMTSVSWNGMHTVWGPLPSVSLEADFFNTAGISHVSGGIAPIPEPSTWLLFALGVALVVVRAVRP